MATVAAPTPGAFQWSLAALETFMAEDQMDLHAAVLRGFSVAELWRLRRVCRAFHRWGTATLASLPRIVVLGGYKLVVGEGEEPEEPEELASVEVLDLSTLRWSSGVVPALPEPRAQHSACCFENSGRVVVVGSDNPETEKTALQWVQGAAGWTPLPDLAERRQIGRRGRGVVALPDGRAVVIGGHGDRPLASIESLAANGSGWSALAPMRTARHGHVAAVLPCGKVLVAGGSDSTDYGDDAKAGMLNTAELWDPATGAWSNLPPMAMQRFDAGCCVLPSGQVAVVGGRGRYPNDYFDSDGDFHSQLCHCDGEVFDPQARTWQTLPPMADARRGHGMVAVAGGMLAVGVGEDYANDTFITVDDTWLPPMAELFDEVSGRWFALPHPMATPRYRPAVVTLDLVQQQATARKAQIAALVAQARDIGPWSAEEKQRFAEAAGWGS